MGAGEQAREVVSVALDAEVLAQFRVHIDQGVWPPLDEIIQNALEEWLWLHTPNRLSHDELMKLVEDGERNLRLHGAQPMTDEMFEDVKRRGRERLSAKRLAAAE